MNFSATTTLDSHPVSPRPQRESAVAAGTVEPHASDMAVVVAADVTLGELQARLGQLEPVPQWLPIDGDPGRTVGELAAEDSTGPLRLTYGGWRDRLTGVQFTDGRGGLVTAGGLAVKNVAGYDLCKLLVGSRGRFGKLVTLTLRTDRRPEGALAATLDVADGDLPRQVNRLMTCDAPPTWMLLAPNGLHLGWLASERELDLLEPAIHEVVDVAPRRRSFEEDAQDRAGRLGAGRLEGARLDVAPAQTAQAARALGVDQFVADPVFGRVWTVEADAWEVEAVAEQFGGHAVMTDEAGLPTLYGDFEDALPLLRRLREQFDPMAALPSLPIRG